MKSDTSQTYRGSSFQDYPEWTGLVLNQDNEEKQHMQ